MGKKAVDPENIFESMTEISSLRSLSLSNKNTHKKCEISKLVDSEFLHVKSGANSRV